MLMIVPGTKNGEILRRPPAMYAAVCVFDERQPADAGADAHAHALLVAGVVVEPGVVDGFDRGGEAVVDERVEAARFLRRQIFADVEALDLARDARGERRGVEARDRGRCRSARADRCPRRRSTPMPTGATMPRPVTTTRRLLMSVTLGRWAPRLQEAMEARARRKRAGRRDLRASAPIRHFLT